MPVGINKFTKNHRYTMHSDINRDNKKTPNKLTFGEGKASIIKDISIEENKKKLEQLISQIDTWIENKQ